MAEKQTFAEKLTVRLKKVGLSERKATEYAKGLASSFSKAPKGKVSEKLTLRLIKFGLTERKAKELAKALVPTVNANIKLKAAKQAAKTGEPAFDGHPDDAPDLLIKKAIRKTVDESNDAELDKVAPRVNGHRLRLDLPVVPMPGEAGLDVLRVMDGLTTRATYLVSAVKGERGLIAIRRFDSNYFNVKFYPTMAAWGRDTDQLMRMGFKDYLVREHYQRMHGYGDAVDQLLQLIAKEAKPRKGIKGLMDRVFGITFGSLKRAFALLHRDKEVAA